MRVLSELINVHEPALPLVLEWIEHSPLSCEVLPPSEARASVLLELQITTRSPMGTIAFETGGLLIDNGWLRVLGSGNPKLERTITGWNRDRASGFLLVADDVVGGFFAINSGGLGGDTGAMYYWAPDTLVWEELGIGYSDFLKWSLSPNLEKFYANLRWTNWQSDAKHLHGDQCFNFYPFLWTEQGSVQTSRRTGIPVSEQFAANVELATQVNGQET